MLELKLVKNSKTYYEFIRKLRNHPKVKPGFIEQVFISKDEQQKYMEKHQKNYFVALLNNNPVGYIGVIDNDIRIAVDPKHQRQGIGLFMIREIKKKYRKAMAKIKIENTASIKLFEKAGFNLRYNLYQPDTRQRLKKLVIYGCSYLEIIRLVDAINQDRPQYKIIGYIDDSPKNRNNLFLSYPVLGDRRIIPKLVKEKDLYFFNNVNMTLAVRKEIAAIFELNHCQVISLIHPLVNVRYSRIGQGSVISEGCIVGTGAKIGRYLTTRYNSVISHDTTLGDLVFVGPNATICGYSRIGDNCYIGAGAIILPRITIGAGSVIAAGAVVKEDLPAGVVASGVPAKIIKKRPGDSYRGRGM